MEQQQQQPAPPPALGGRPWFRLGSMIRGDPTPAPPQPQPQLPQPTLRQPLLRTQSQLLPGVPTGAPPPTRPAGGTASMPPSPVLRPATIGGAPIGAPPPTRPAGGIASMPPSPVLRPATIGGAPIGAPPPTRPAGGTASMPPSPVLRAATAGGASSVPQTPRAPPRRGPEQLQSQSPQQQTMRPSTNGSTGGTSSPRPARATEDGPGGTISSVPQSPKLAGVLVPKQQQKKTDGGAASLPGSPLQATTRGGVFSVPQSPPPQPPKSLAVPSPKTIKSSRSTSPRAASKSPPPSPAKATAKPPPEAGISPVERSPKTIKPFSSPPPPLRLPSPQLKPADDVMQYPEPEPKRSLFDIPKHDLSLPPPKAANVIDHNGLQEKKKPAAAPSTKPVEPNYHHRGSLNDNTKSSIMQSYSAPRNLADEEYETGGGYMRVITIAGENKGAIMELLGRRPLPNSSSRTTTSMIKKKLNPAETTKDPIEEEEKKKPEKLEKKKAAAAAAAAAAGAVPMSAFVNSNVQTVNNSILFNASCAMSSPGVHIALSRHPSAGTRKVVEHAPKDNGHQDHRHH